MIKASSELSKCFSDTNLTLPKVKPKVEQSRKTASPSDYFLKYMKQTKNI